MQIVKNIWTIVFFLIINFLLVTTVQAVGCMVVPGDEVCEEVILADGVPQMYCYTPWTTGDCGGVDNGGCPPNYHSTPNGGCQPNGSGGSTGGGNEPSCNYAYIINCPPGYTRGNNVISTTEVSIQNLRNCNNAVGSAQTLGSCSSWTYDTDQGFDVCWAYYVNNYQCYTGCGTGSTLQCVNVPENYTYNSTTASPGCPSGHTAVSGITYGACYLTTNDKGHWVNVCPTSITCQRYVESCSCVSACTQTAPTGLSIVAGPTVGTTATVDWTLGTGGEAQYIWIDEDQTEVSAGCPTSGDCEMSVQLPASANNMLVSGLTPLRTYYIRIVNIGGPGCSSEITGTYTTPASTGVISGKVYLDSGNNCGTTAFPGQNVVLDGVTTAVSGADGSFTYNAAVAATHTLAVTIPSGYTCSTAAGCSGCSKSGVVSSSANNYFYLTQNRDAWWQAKGAGVYAGSSAGGVTIGSTIPNSVVDNYLVIPDGGSAAAVVRASGDSPSLGQGSVNSESWSAKSTYKGKRADYNYFAKEMGVVPSTTSDWQSDTLNQQAYNSSKDFWYVDPAGTAAISSAWQVANGEKYTVFVNGDLRIGADIVVAPGGFLAFIVKGDVTIDPAVANIQGLYVTQDNFITESAGTDVQLEVEGSVVAWGDISLTRDMVANNSNSPAEIFRYRADLMTNMPDEMKSFVMQWKEVVPGTYESQ